MTQSLSHVRMLQSAKLMNIKTQDAHQKTLDLCKTIGKAIKGKQQTIQFAVVALLAEGHC